jgi:ribosomal protein S12 methylthiotransferase
LLSQLLETLLAETSIPWFRLFYMYPSGIQPELVELIASERRVVRYLDMPVQHGSDAVLKRMRRPERQHTIRERVRWLRAAIPDVTLRTTVITGFPGETEDDFRAMLELLEELRFDHLGAFPYSVEESTPAAAMAEQVPETVKRERLEQLLDLQRSISLEKNEARVGRQCTVLVDRIAPVNSVFSDSAESASGALGRTESQALEIDGAVHIPQATTARAGDFVTVRITDALEYDLIAELANSPS